MSSASNAMNALRGRLFRLRSATFGSEIDVEDFLENHVAPAKVVILGEIHGEKPIVGLQTRIQETLARAAATSSSPSSYRSSLLASSSSSSARCDASSLLDHNSPSVQVVMEHFSLDMQDILDEYQSGVLDMFGLREAYKRIGSEGHDLRPYAPVLESARANPSGIRLRGGFVPRTYARLLMREGVDAALSAAVSRGYVSEHERLRGTDAHYDFFEGLLTGRDIHDRTRRATDDFRARMFPAQILKDASMAHTVNEILRRERDRGGRVLVVCGSGHMLYGHGVPERIAVANDDGDGRPPLRVVCLPTDDEYGDREPEFVLAEAYGGPETDAADFCFLYKADDEEDEESNVREETRRAYDKVGATAYLEGGDARMAEAVMTSLHYTKEEFEFAGADAVNFQGVGCPHRHADIQTGESVLDLGSGLGVDSLIASRAVGPDGRVVGLDLSQTCVEHASRRARDRGVDENRLRFRRGALEDATAETLGINTDNDDDDDERFDVIISNGAFCLVPDKRGAFENCRRLLKPGGRIAVCTTVLRRPEGLDGDVDWPVCMESFAKMDDLVPMLTELGFENVEVDTSDDKMEMELEVEEDEDEKKTEGDHDDDEDDETGRFKVHNKEGRKEFAHLENFNMNELCARVTVKARKRFDLH